MTTTPTTRSRMRVRPTLRTERLAVPLMVLGAILAYIAGLSMDAAPQWYGLLLLLMPLGALIFLLGIALSGEPLSEYVDMGGRS